MSDERASDHRHLLRGRVQQPVELQPAIPRREGHDPVPVPAAPAGEHQQGQGRKGRCPGYGVRPPTNRPGTHLKAGQQNCQARPRLVRTGGSACRRRMTFPLEEGHRGAGFNCKHHEGENKMTKAYKEHHGPRDAGPVPARGHGRRHGPEREVSECHDRVPDARSGLDPLRGARFPRLQGRDDEALPVLQGDLPERRRRRVAPAAAVQFRDLAGRQGHRPRSCRLDRCRLARQAGAGPGRQGHRL